VSTTSIISFDRVSKSYQGREAISDITFEVEDGSVTVVIGPSGCGKSTLLNLAAGLETASSGLTSVEGVVVKGPTPRTALLFQNYNLFPWMTALDNVAFGLRSYMSKHDARGEAKQLLAKVGLSAIAAKTPSELSGGMRQRIAFVRALALRPKVLLLDEPFAALDYQTRKIMQAYLLATWRDTGASVLMVTHDLNEALTVADRIVLMSGSPGRVVDVVDLDLARPRNLSDERIVGISDYLRTHLEVQAAKGDFGPDEMKAIAEFMPISLMSEINSHSPLKKIRN
jgi:NitT/TauT family transport system ATP-binding protein